MANKAARMIITIIGFAIGFQIMFLMLYFNNYLGFFHLDYLPTLAVELVGTLIIGIIFYFLSPRIISICIKAKDWIENKLQTTPMQDILYGFLGTVMGLLLANLFTRAFLGIPWIGGYIPIIFNIIMAYLGASIALKKKDELSNIISSSLGTLQKKKKKPAVINLVKPKILDTSVIIDGRIADICRTGFIEGTLVIPGFVLEELRHIADSSDGLKRNRGRRGLDILNRIQKELDIEVEIYEGDFEDIAEVDSKLVKLAQVLEGCIITNDFNLNKVAEFQKVKVLNINELANAVKPVVLPGEEMMVQVIKDGKEMGQGVAYLDDGTMIVVDGGKKYIGDTIEVVVTSVLQTAAGRMIFAKPKSL
ncbi:PIN/TRAM domain-containing protein [Tepidanaerobacter acetatoxydans]|uniref:PIN/TRAM domain-containing protein n=1 Tax=Tepidanaerobacter acetatoxydans TaxID=499229 RepID=UPI001BD3C9F1|nr:PIN/TRAM domain-containing protein [Tepidanaerobacter acetatoxydans]